MSNIIEALTETARGSVIIPSDSDYDDDRALANYGANYQRLAVVKATDDPDNLFHINQNIVPANGRRASWLSSGQESRRNE